MIKKYYHATITSLQSVLWFGLTFSPVSHFDLVSDSVIKVDDVLKFCDRDLFSIRALWLPRDQFPRLVERQRQYHHANHPKTLNTRT